MDLIPVEISATSVNVHLGCPKPTCTLPKVTDNPEREDNRKSQIGLEETLCGAKAGFANWSSYSGVKLTLS
jgi:hypothetical protein